MSDPTTQVSAMRAITISREYGSGGGEVARRLATALSWRLIDHEAVTQVALRLGVEETDVEQRDERTQGWIEQFFTNMSNVGPVMVVPSDLTLPPDPQMYVRALRDVVLGATKAGHVVIVGRGSQMVLRNRRDVLHLRLVAPLDQRIAYVAGRERLDPNDARQRIMRKDQERRRYLSATYQIQPDDAHLYDLTLNSGALGLNACVDLALQALERKAALLIGDLARLALGADLTPYPTAPANFQPPNGLAATESSGATPEHETDDDAKTQAGSAQCE